MSLNDSRRNFLRTVPFAAAGAITLETRALAAVGGSVPTSAPFQLFSAAKLAGDAEALKAKPGNNNLVADSKTLSVTVVMTVEEKKAAKEFEFHEGRDHIVQILAGETVYEVGGTPQEARNTKPGEWLAATSAGATKMTLTKGDMLVIPRGCPHKRTTEGSVTFLLISPMGAEV